jgi:hypothetical protein
MQPGARVIDGIQRDLRAGGVTFIHAEAAERCVRAPAVGTSRGEDG